jgi:hypothetical protein
MPTASDDDVELDGFKPVDLKLDILIWNSARGGAVLEAQRSYAPRAGQDAGCPAPACVLGARFAGPRVARDDDAPAHAFVRVDRGDVGCDRLLYLCLRLRCCPHCCRPWGRWTIGWHR